MSLPKYGEYKDSGVPWLGKVPSHWEVYALKRELSFLTSGSRGWAEHYSDDGPLFIRIGNLTRDSASLDLTDIQRVAPPEGAEGERTMVRAGDLLFSITAYLGSVAVVPDDIEQAYISQHIALARLQGKRVLPIWAAYVALSWVGKTYLETQGYGGTKVQLSLDDVGNLLITVPPLAEQSAITAFLNRETSKIDALIAEQEKLIALLSEKRQATISHVVTRGLNPNVPMKDSGVAWLGEVPAHWEVVPLMHLTHPARPIMYGIVLPGPNVDSGIPIVKGGDVKEHRLKLDLLNRTTADIEAPFARARLKPLDIVYSIRGTIGDAEVVPDELVDANITQDVARISPAPGIQTRWLLHVMKAKPIFVQLEQRSLGAAVRGINIFELKRARIPVPPASERNCIAEFLDAEITKINVLRREAERTIGLLKERRSALIAAAVTGHIDVRSDVPLGLAA